MSRRLPDLLCLTAVLLALLWPDRLVAQNCRAISMTAEAFAAWHNPQPSNDDFLLPVPGGISLVFVPVPLGTTGLYGDERTTYTMGSTEPTIYETPLEVRVGSSITDRRGQTRMLIGKYEVTKAQYAMIMANGDLAAGLRILRNRTKATRVHTTIDPYLEEGSSCEGKMTGRLHRMLSEPLTFLSYRDYVEFLDKFNLFCVSRNDCREILLSLGPNRDIPGFLRLPSEHEWEFVARGGRYLVSGRLTKSAIQSDVPILPSGTTINDFAHAGNDPPNALPIGSREPLFGFYDLFGNAQELMGNAFTAENGFGAVGAYVARGGHFGLDYGELRASRRVELTAFRVDDSTGLLDIQYFPRTGLRLAVGLPVAGAAERLGDTSLVDDFVENYVAPDQAGDSAGNRQSEARQLGNLGDEPLDVIEELDPDDAEDWYLVQLQDYGQVVIDVEGGQGLTFEIIDARQDTLGEAQGPSPLIQTGSLLPGDYWLRVHSGSRRVTSEIRYRLEASRTVEADSGIARPDPSALSSALFVVTEFSQPVEGFVGRGDVIDTFPIINRSELSGLEVELSADANLTLSLLDEQLNLTQRETYDFETSSGSVLMPMEVGFRGFLQIEAEPPAQSIYTIRLRTRLPFNPLFLTEYPPSVSSVPAFAQSNQTYEGVIAGNQMLYLPFQLDGARSVKAELSSLEADVSMSVVGQGQRVVSSDHARSGTQAEFFSKTLEEGTYFIVLRMVQQSEKSSFKLAFRADSPEGVSGGTESFILEAVRASALGLGVLGPSRISTLEVMQGQFQYFRFSIAGRGQQTVEIKASSDFFPEDFDLYLENASGAVIAKSAVRRRGLEVIVTPLNAGNYYVLVSRSDGFGAAWLNFEAVAFGDVQNPNLSWAGTVIERIGDFSIFQGQFQGGTAPGCTLLTVAKSVTPSAGWRAYKPSFSIQVTPESSAIVIAMDQASTNDGSDLYRPGTLQGSVVGQGDIPLIWQDRRLKPLAPCSNGSGGLCMAGGVVTKLVEGDDLVLSGLTPAGAPAEVRFSLNGYKAAGQRINTLCNSESNWIWDN